MQDEYSLFEYLFVDWKLKHVSTNDTGFALKIVDLNATPKPSTMLRMLLKPTLISEEEISKILVAQTGSFIETAACRILKNRDEIVVQFTSNKNTNAEFTIDLNEVEKFGFSLRKYDRTEDTMIDKNRFVAMLDFDKISFPLQVRIWEKGDTFFPFGMEQKKLVSDFLTNEKLSLFEKEKAHVVVSNNEIVWVAGHRIDNRFAITDTTTKILELRKN
jgi:tRNA(Ile)-lysidine synthase